MAARSNSTIPTSSCGERHKGVLRGYGCSSWLSLRDDFPTISPYNCQPDSRIMSPRLAVSLISRKLSEAARSILVSLRMVDDHAGILLPGVSRSETGSRRGLITIVRLLIA